MKGTSKTSQAGKSNKSMSASKMSPAMKMYTGFAVGSDKKGKSNSKAQVDTMPGQKSMSKAHMPMAQGKMSTAQAVVKSGPTKGMINSSGRIGAGCEGFKRGGYDTEPNPIPSTAGQFADFGTGKKQGK